MVNNNLTIQHYEDGLIDLHHGRMRPRRQISIMLIAVMWFLGLIEWSEPSVDCIADDARASITVVKHVWKRRILSLTSRLHLCTLIFQNLCCGGFYIKHYFGDVNKFYRFATYLLSYWSLMVTVQIVCLITNFRHWFFITYYSNVNSQWWTVFTESSISQRLHPFHFSTFRPPKGKTFLFFALCALACIGFEVMHFYYVNRDVKHHTELYSYLQISSTVNNIWFFSMFCYFLYIQRIALQVNFDSLIWFVKNHVGELDLCHTKLTGCFNDYIRMRRLVHPLITFVICATAFGLTVHMAWNYDVMNEEPIEMNTTPVPVMMALNLTEGTKFDFNVLDMLIFVEKVVVLLLLLLAVGGSDVGYIWKRCHLTISIMYTSRRDKFWLKLSKTMNHLNLNTTADDTIIDLLLPLLLIAIGVLNFQQFGF